MPLQQEDDFSPPQPRLKRCSWVMGHPLPVYLSYHDEEWGVPEFDDRQLFEKLILDSFQAGLSWLVILKKRENFRNAFDAFNPEKIARYGPEKIAALMTDEGLVRHKGKIDAAVKAAQAYLKIMEREGFSNFLWKHANGTPIRNTFKKADLVPVETDASRRLSQSLRKEGFSFCGPVIVYAFMQAVGMTNDHLVECFRHAECDAKAKERATLTAI